jgi:hypothetical protein
MRAQASPSGSASTSAGKEAIGIYAYPGQPEQLNLQPLNGQAKPYQLRQLLRLIDRYGLELP